MKKKLLIMLLAMLMLLQFCACQPSAQEDAGNANASASTDELPRKKPVILVDSIMTKRDAGVLRYTQYLNTGYTAQIQCLSENPERREIELSTLRTEIMAGGGPDAFVLPCSQPDVWVANGFTQGDPLFPDVEKVMQSRIFLPLDDLIAQSESINMEEHWEVIMEAGRTEEGQVVLPLSFYIPAYFIDRSKMKDPNAKFSTWDDFLNSDETYALEFVRARALGWFGMQYTQLADYESENVLVTPEEIKEDLAAFASIAPGEITEEEKLMELCCSSVVEQKAGESDTYRVLPLMNRDGGFTACINAFAAINRNSELAEEAFKYIETMFREEVQNNEGIVTGDPARGGRFIGKSNRPDGMHVADTTIGISTGKTAYPEEAGELISKMMEKVNYVRFRSKLDDALVNSFELAAAGTDKDETYFEKLAEDVCDEMEMILAE